MMNEPITFELLESISEVEPSQWNDLVGDGYPFIRHEFLFALEQSGSVSEQAGWKPMHLIGRDSKGLALAMPGYLKWHSYGEYVFDFQWAHAYQRYGLQYYPKWLTAIPFTPCAGPRVSIRGGLDDTKTFEQIQFFIESQCREKNLSSWHCLFPEKQWLDRLSAHPLGVREGVQFQWFNQGYENFDDFLATFSSKKRKNVKRERRLVADQGIEMLCIPGNEITETQWKTFYAFYSATYFKRGQEPYLTPQFFQLLLQNMPSNLLLVMAIKDQHYVAGALSFIGDDTLYGRYWGCLDEYDSLHFETCYYQGIEFCIERGLKRFDSGAQGEHKIVRGFEPVKTYSLHYIRDAQFDAAIKDFLKREKLGIDQYQSETAEWLPFKKTSV